jgi:hypothetical protein
VRGRGALSGGSTRGARGAGAEPSGAKGCGFESFREVPWAKIWTNTDPGYVAPRLQAASHKIGEEGLVKEKAEVLPVSKTPRFLTRYIFKMWRIVARRIFLPPHRIAPQLRAQGHVEARRQKVLPIRGHTAKDRLAVRRDAAEQRQWLAAVGAGAAKVLDLL